MRWAGFRKVRAQVCKRIMRRVKELHIADIAEYRVFLESHQQEWLVLDRLCRVTISRFYRDKAVFDFLARQALPTLAKRVIARGESTLKLWSAGCGSGEEPYTLSLIGSLSLQTLFPELIISIIATDASAEMIHRARQASYSDSSITQLPPQWLSQAFDVQNNTYRLKTQYRKPVRFYQQDIRHHVPQGPFDLVLCRNLVFTYFDESLQATLLEDLLRCIKPGGALVIGIHEKLPATTPPLRPWSEKRGIYQILSYDSDQRG